MAAATNRYGWAYPDPADAPDTAGYLGDLANAVEESLGQLDDRLTTLTGLSQSVMQYTTLARVSASIPTIPNAAWTPITFDAAQFNLPTSNPGFVLASPTRITCMQTGLYHMTGFAGFAINSTGSRAIAIRVNGNPSYAAITSGDNPSADIQWFGCVVVEARLNTDDYVELVVRQTSGAGLKLDDVLPRFSVRRMV